MGDFPGDCLAGLSATLNCGVDDLEAVLDSPGCHYRRFAIRRTRKRPRWIDAPSLPLKRLQRTLLERLLYRLSPDPSAHGFFPGRSIVTNARPHVGKKWVVSLDVKDFFPSTTEQLVLATLKGHSSDVPAGIWEVAARLCCLDGRLPQGAPTSPHLANLAFAGCDNLLQGIAREHELVYTRYADDMTFSGESLPEGLEGLVQAAIAPAGYLLASQKTKVMGRNKRQEVTGLVVNERVALPRHLRRRLRAVMHDAKRNGLVEAVGNCRFLNSENELFGHLAFRRMVEAS